MVGGSGGFRHEMSHVEDPNGHLASAESQETWFRTPFGRTVRFG